MFLPKCPSVCRVHVNENKVYMIAKLSDLADDHSEQARHEKKQRDRSCPRSPDFALALIENDFHFQFHTIQTKNEADVNRR